MRWRRDAARRGQRHFGAAGRGAGQQGGGQVRRALAASPSSVRARAVGLCEGVGNPPTPLSVEGVKILEGFGALACPLLVHGAALVMEYLLEPEAGR